MSWTIFLLALKLTVWAYYRQTEYFGAIVESLLFH